jgi:hypothetical protein
LTLAKIPCGRSAVSARLSTKARSAQFNLSSLPGEHRHDHFQIRCRTLQNRRLSPSHTVKELLSRGLKSRSGVCAPRSTFCLSAALRCGGPRSYLPQPPHVNTFSKKKIQHSQKLCFKGYGRFLPRLSQSFLRFICSHEPFVGPLFLPCRSSRSNARANAGSKILSTAERFEP